MRSPAPTTSVVEFDPEGRLVRGDAVLFPDAPPIGAPLDAVLEAALEMFATLDGLSAEAPTARAAALARWRDPTGAPIEAEGRDGVWRLLSSYAGPDGALVALAVDITERKARERLEARLMRAHPLPAWANDLDSGEVVYANPAALDLFEAAGAEASNVAEFFADPARNVATREALLETGRVDDYAVHARTSSGREIWVSGAARTFEHHGARLVVSAILDVTDQKRRDDETAQARAWLNDAIQSLSEGFALYDEDARLVLCNDRYRDRPPAVAAFIEPGMHWETLLRESARRGVYSEATAGREQAFVLDRLEQAAEFRQASEVEHADGRCFLVSVHPTRLGGFVVTRADITEKRRAEALARESDLLLRKVLDACPAPIVLSRIGDGEILFQTPEAERLFGAHDSTRVHVADAGARADFLTALLPIGRIDDFEMTARRADGGPFPCLMSARLIDYKGEQVIVSSTTDLSEQVEARRALARANERLNDAIESLDEGFALIDAERRLVTFNRRYVEMNALISDVISVGVPYLRLLEASVERGALPPDDPAVLDGDQSLRNRYEADAPNGFFLSSRNPTSDGGFVITKLDITEKKRAEAAERAADALMRQVLEACRVAIHMNRMDGEIIYRTPSSAAFFGPDCRNSRDHYADPADRGPYMKRLLAKGWIDDYAVDVRRADGALRRAAVSAQIISYQGEQVMVTLVRDVTEELRMHEELAQQRELIHQSEKMSALGELLAGVAHELNNPLSVVVGHAMMLEEETADPALERRVAKIAGAAERCAKIVKTFLAMARQRPAKLERMSVNAIIETALDVAGYGLRQLGASVSLRLASELPPVRADADQMAQVFTNLLVNAEHALARLDRPGALTIETGYDVAAGEVTARFTDNGDGVPEAIRARIFEPFFTTKRVGEGTGVGLAFCHRIVETHGGRIQLISRPGAGASFIVRLPIAPPAESSAEGGAGEPGAPRAARVLVVEDEPEVAALIEEILRADGCEVARAGTGLEALAALQGGGADFQLILSDLNMPALDGRELLARIAAWRPEMVERVAFITGDGMGAGAQRFLEAAGRPYLEKPVAPNELRRLMRRLLASGASAEGG